MQRAFDDGGFALDDVEKPSLNVSFDHDAWDDTEILEIFDAAVRSHTTKGTPAKSKKSKMSNMKHSNIGGMSKNTQNRGMTGHGDRSGLASDVAAGTKEKDREASLDGQSAQNIYMGKNAHRDSEAKENNYFVSSAGGDKPASISLGYTEQAHYQENAQNTAASINQVSPRLG